jgi:hypothetical protein
MTGRGLVSIIIPAFNDVAWIGAAVDSALAQTYPSCEIIVVDDGSTDGTGALIRSRYGRRVRYVHQPNRGLPAARNAGLALAVGEYVQFLDADDILLPSKVADHVDILEQDPECIVVYSDFAFIDGSEERRPSGFQKRYRSGNVFSDLLDDNFIVVHAALSRRSDILAVGGFDENLVACEDYDLWLKLAAEGRRFAHTPAVLVLYRQRAGSMSQDVRRQIDSTIAVIEKVPAYAVLDEQNRERHRHRLASLRDLMVRSLVADGFASLRSGRFFAAAARLLEAVTYDPAGIPTRVVEFGGHIRERIHARLHPRLESDTTHQGHFRPLHEARTMTRASIVIPTWNGAALLNDALLSLRRQTWQDFEIIVVDNGSTDGTAALLAAQHPEVRLIELGRNRGFAAAVNAGIGAARGDLVVLMNNDVEAAPGWIAALIDAMDAHPAAGSCASRMLSHADPSRIDSAGDMLGLFATSIGHGELDGPAFDVPVFVLSACAGAAAYRRTLLEETGGFDERFFAYLEDIDLGIRFQLAGWDCLYVPDAVVYHHGSATARRMPEMKLFLLMRNSLFLFFQYMPLRTLLVWGPAMLAWPLYRVMRERQPLRLGVRAVIAFLRDIPAVRRRRADVAQTRRLTPAEFKARLSGWRGDRPSRPAPRAPAPPPRAPAPPATRLEPRR